MYDFRNLLPKKEKINYNFTMFVDNYNINLCACFQSLVYISNQKRTENSMISIEIQQLLHIIPRIYIYIPFHASITSMLNIICL